MRRGLTTFLVVVIVIVGLVAWGASAYNRLVTLGERVDAQWGQVENQLMRRFDLIPALVQAAEAYAAHEKEVFARVSDARAKLAGAQSVEEKVGAANELQEALSRLLVVVEAYPDLKASDVYRQYMDAVEGTENRLATERMRFNELVRDFNVAIKRFPALLYARALGFVEREYVKAPPGAETAPTGK
ncbi:MAG: LemA family protein [Acetobacteraceae bacterium]|nr:LemA family protein [Acetobacteraceae bacterium]